MWLTGYFRRAATFGGRGEGEGRGVTFLAQRENKVTLLSGSCYFQGGGGGTGGALLS